MSLIFKPDLCYVYDAEGNYTEVEGMIYSEKPSVAFYSVDSSRIPLAPHTFMCDSENLGLFKAEGRVDYVANNGNFFNKARRYRVATTPQDWQSEEITSSVSVLLSEE